MILLLLVVLLVVSLGHEVSGTVSRHSVLVLKVRDSAFKASYYLLG